MVFVESGAMVSVESGAMVSVESSAKGGGTCEGDGTSGEVME